MKLIQVLTISVIFVSYASSLALAQSPGHGESAKEKEAEAVERSNKIEARDLVLSCIKKIGSVYSRMSEVTQNILYGKTSIDLNNPSYQILNRIREGKVAVQRKQLDPKAASNEWTYAAKTFGEKNLREDRSFQRRALSVESAERATDSYLLERTSTALLCQGSASHVTTTDGKKITFKYKIYPEIVSMITELESLASLEKRPEIKKEYDGLIKEYRGLLQDASIKALMEKQNNI